MAESSSKSAVTPLSLQKFYYTFAPDFHPYHNGWIVINAPNITLANSLFRQLFPNPKHPECLNCSFVYPEDSFRNTCMFKNNDNMGRSLIAEFSISMTSGSYENPDTGIRFPEPHMN